MNEAHFQIKENILGSFNEKTTPTQMTQVDLFLP
jgi:hypothetical protein